ncbi:hypothetical protein JL721_1515 [Aureococcus anophagefferens]|nr:hypothetical protein JL721_1515 [Aureococcus anophagefferens]
MSEVDFASCQRAFDAAATPAAQTAAARRAGALLDAAEGDMFSSAEEVRASLTAGCSSAFLAAITAATPRLASSAVRGKLEAGVAWPAKLDGDGRCVAAFAKNCRDVCGDKALQRALGSCLEDDALASGDGRAKPDGRAVDALKGRVPAAAYFSELPNFPKTPADAANKQAAFLRQRLRETQDGVHALVNKALRVDKGAKKEGVVAWLARSVALGAPLAAPRLKERGRHAHPAGCCSAGHGLNLCGLVLRLAAPVADKGDFNLLSALGFFPPGEAHGFKFSTEAFFLAVKAVGTFFVPLFDEFHLQQRALAEGRGRDDVAAYRARLHAEGWVCHLEDPVLLENAGKVASFAAKWLLHQMADGDFAPGDPRAGSAPKERMAALPANLVKNACDVWSCLARASDGRRGAACFGDQDAAAAALFCCELMRRPDLVASPVVHAKLVEFLTQLLRTARGPASRKAEASLFFGPGRGLAGAVMDSERVRRELPPAFVHLYGEVHAVVGLDVDADQAFDKFNVRHRVNALLSQFWRHPLGEPRAALARLFGDAAKAATFAGACLDTMVYCGEDSLDRLADGVLREVDGKPPPEATPARDFYDSQQRVCRGFLPQACSTLDVLLEFVEQDASVAKALLGAPPALRVAVAHALRLVESCGTADGLARVRPSEPEAWAFDADALLDYAARLEAARAANARPSRRRCGGRPTTAAPRSSEAAAKPSARARPGRRRRARGRRRRRRRRGGGRRRRARGARWSAAPPGGRRSAPKRAYADAFGDATVEVVDELADHHFRSKPAGTRNAKALQKELRRLKRDLPEPHPGGSVFVRFDEGRLDLCRCALTGPADTPYFGGLFVFDVYFPQDYPAVPPLVHLTTTGSGTVRFNPNLYADGKVCLSLLGTWHAADASQKWNADTSTLTQVLLSIAGQILVKEPYFNEPAYERVRGTPEGDATSERVNGDLRNKTRTCAVVDHLKRPPRGLEELALAFGADDAPEPPTKRSRGSSEED